MTQRKLQIHHQALARLPSPTIKPPKTTHHNPEKHPSKPTLRHQQSQHPAMPRPPQNPPPLTHSAREALTPFHCTLCGKGYQRKDEYDRHTMSYDHLHNERRKELRSLNNAMAGSSGGRKREGAGEIKAIKVEEAGEGRRRGGFKKGGFRSSFVGGDGEGGGGGGGGAEADGEKGDVVVGGVEGSESDDEARLGYECYDPRRPTGCFVGCEGRGV